MNVLSALTGIGRCFEVAVFLKLLQEKKVNIRASPSFTPTNAETAIVQPRASPAFATAKSVEHVGAASS